MPTTDMTTTTNGPVIRLLCCSCGARTRGRQWHNRDTGYGICGRCSRVQRGKETVETMRSYYGIEGEHYFPDPAVDVSTARYLPSTQVAAAIRKALKAAFPATTFSVKTDKYSGGSTIRTNWFDGPTETQVRAVAGQFSGERFDGMIDLSYSLYHWLKPDGSATLAYTEGTTGSMGVYPAEEHEAPCDGCELVSFGSTYTDETRRISAPVAQIVVNAICDRFGIEHDRSTLVFPDPYGARLDQDVPREQLEGDYLSRYLRIIVEAIDLSGLTTSQVEDRAQAMLEEKYPSPEPDPEDEPDPERRLLSFPQPFASGGPRSTWREATRSELVDVFIAEWNQFAAFVPVDLLGPISLENVRSEIEGGTSTEYSILVWQYVMFTPITVEIPGGPSLVRGYTPPPTLERRWKVEEWYRTPGTREDPPDMELRELGSYPSTWSAASALVRRRLEDSISNAETGFFE